MNAHESYPLNTKFCRKRSNQKVSIEDLVGFRGERFLTDGDVTSV
jgi:hypothetical protein